jgi:very-short-patch-repair endonuclease
MGTQDKIETLRQRHVDKAAKNAHAEFDYWLPHCDSPIEQLFLAKLLVDGWRMVDHPNTWRAAVARIESRPGVKRGKLLLHSPWDENLRADLQTSVRDGRYRIDFAFFSGGERWAVELDGHDFHEKTKSQATRDKRRDRELVADGWRVLRYTGSEIYSDVDAVYDEVCDHLTQSHARSA